MLSTDIEIFYYAVKNKMKLDILYGLMNQYYPIKL